MLLQQRRYWRAAWTLSRQTREGIRHCTLLPGRCGKGCRGQQLHQRVLLAYYGRIAFTGCFNDTNVCSGREEGDVAFHLFHSLDWHPRGDRETRRACTCS
jgi:hypothetical protein